MNLYHIFFFECKLATYVWSLVAYVIGAGNRPTSFEQYWLWVHKDLQNKKYVYTVGLAAYAGPSGSPEIMLALKEN